MRRGVVFVSKIIVWATVGLSVAILLFWLALGEYWIWGGRFGEDFWTMLIRSVLLGGAILICGVFHFLPLYGADAFLWFGVRGALNIEERRWFWVTMCALGILLSAGVIAWYVREAVLLDVDVFTKTGEGGWIDG